MRRTGSPDAALAAASRILTNGGDPFQTLGFADRADFERVVGEALPGTK